MPVERTPYERELDIAALEFQSTIVAIMRNAQTPEEGGLGLRLVAHAMGLACFCTTARSGGEITPLDALGMVTTGASEFIAEMEENDEVEELLTAITNGTAWKPKGRL